MMNRIIIHHAGSSYTPSQEVKRAYHGSIDGDAERHDGLFPVEANAPGKIKKGHYAAHTRALNTGSIGRSICAMAGADWSDPSGSTIYPVKPEQIDALALWVAEDAREWNIPVDRRHVLSHAEVEITLGVWQRNKWDFDYGLGVSGRDPVAHGDEFRQEVTRLLGGVIEKPEPWVSLSRGAKGREVRRVQKRLGLVDDGKFGPVTHGALVKFQKAHNLLPDGVVGPMTWAAMFPEEGPEA